MKNTKITNDERLKNLTNDLNNIKKQIDTDNTTIAQLKKRIEINAIAYNKVQGGIDVLKSIIEQEVENNIDKAEVTRCKSV